MLTLDFPGSRALIEAIDAAVSKPTTHELTDHLRHSLCKLIRENAVTLPDCVFEANAEHYARRELYRSEQHGYCVVAMTVLALVSTIVSGTAALKICSTDVRYSGKRRQYSSRSIASPRPRR